MSAERAEERPAKIKLAEKSIIQIEQSLNEIGMNCRPEDEAEPTFNGLTRS